MSNFYFSFRLSRLVVILLLAISVTTVLAQTPQFTYQGLLNDGGNPANGSYDLQFRLFDAAVGGTQVGSTVISENVTVSNGLFKVALDFGAAAFPGANRWLEIAVRPGASTGAFTTLSPLQALTATPYAIRSLNAGMADGLSVACVNCVTSGQISTVQGSQVTGAIAGGQITGAIPVASITAGSSNYVQNTTTQQASTNFNIAGNGTASGTLSASTVNATAQFNLGGSRILSRPGTYNLFAGFLAGSHNVTGLGNSFFGESAGEQNDTGRTNSFFGAFTGGFNTAGEYNSFFGGSAGAENTLGSRNSFFGNGAGLLNHTNSDNSFFGHRAGEHNTADGNSFFGTNAGTANTTGTGNAFFGDSAGTANTTANYNAFFGSLAGTATTTGTENTFLGRRAGESNTTGANNTFVGWGAGNTNTTGGQNTIIGRGADVGANNLSYATAIGADVIVSASNTIQLGRSSGSETVRVPGKLVVGTLAAATATHLCINGSGELAACSSSLRYKNNVQSFAPGMNLIQRLRPVTFNWKESNAPDLGLIAEEVAAVEPLLVTRNPQGEIQGVKYDQLSVVLINALKQQQEQLKRQEAEIAQLKQLVCALQPQAAVCQAR